MKHIHNITERSTTWMIVAYENDAGLDTYRRQPHVLIHEVDEDPGDLARAARVLDKSLPNWWRKFEFDPSDIVLEIRERLIVVTEVIVPYTVGMWKFCREKVEEEDGE